MQTVHDNEVFFKDHRARKSHPLYLKALLDSYNDAFVFLCFLWIKIKQRRSSTPTHGGHGCWIIRIYIKNILKAEGEWFRGTKFLKPIDM